MNRFSCNWSVSFWDRLAFLFGFRKVRVVLKYTGEVNMHLELGGNLTYNYGSLNVPE